jgi:DNA-binding NarL/FixJ family response regulator
LVVDDHFVVRLGLAAVLNAKADLQVVAEAENGFEAIERFRKHHPDITLMDLLMHCRQASGGTVCGGAIDRP